MTDFVGDDFVSFAALQDSERVFVKRLFAISLISALLIAAWSFFYTSISFLTDRRSQLDSTPPIGRFVPVTPNTALDTRTGKLCYSYDPLPTIGGKIPTCESLK